MVERGLADSRTRAQALVLEGKVRVFGQVETKASRQLDESADLELEAPPRFVSRGGEKLQGAFDLWDLKVEGKVIYNYDRWLDVPPQNEAAEIALALLMHEYN